VAGETARDLRFVPESPPSDEDLSATSKRLAGGGGRRRDARRTESGDRRPSREIFPRGFQEYAVSAVQPPIGRTPPPIATDATQCTVKCSQACPRSGSCVR
ncbi:unnamed protein product, partial [Ectocarpus sp. 12 AP-2014]